MSCCNDQSKKEALHCPVCGEAGTVVKTITPMSLLKGDLVHLVSAEKVYRYCKNRNCTTSYFTNEQLFSVDNLKVKATQKDDGLDVPLCYCFHYTRERILRDVMSNGTTEVINEIKGKMKDPGCFCETSNPQGSCCLGNVFAWIKEAEACLVAKNSRGGHD